MNKAPDSTRPLNAKLAKLAAEITAKAQTAGFTTSSHTALHGTDYERQSITVNHPSLSPTYFDRTVVVELVESKIKITYRTGYFLKGNRRYTALDGIVAKLINNLTEDFKAAVEHAKKHEAQNKTEQDLAVIRKTELAGLVLPPGSKIHIFQPPSSYPASHAYAIDFKGNDSIVHAYLTAGQVRQLADTLNLIQNSYLDATVVVCAKDGENTWYWHAYSHGWHKNDPEVLTREKAEANLALAQSKLHFKDIATIMPYSKVAII